jgi:beta-lactamase class A
MMRGTVWPSLDRRRFHRLAGGMLAAAMPAWTRAGLHREWASIEAPTRGRLGVAVQQADGRIQGHRLDERFPLCSTFKWLLAAQVLQRVDDGHESLQRRVRSGRGGSVAALCEAAITLSDNTAANLLLASVGGPQALTHFARSLGDPVTRLDRWEPALNEAKPGDPRDTTSPRAMAGLLRTVLLGAALSETSRAQLLRWLEATRTNGQRLRADLPAGWRMGSKTGTGPRGTTNDVGIFWPPAGPPVLVAVYLTASEAQEAVRNGAVAAVARRVTAR